MTQKQFNTIVGPVLFLLATWVLPDFVFHTLKAKAAIGTILWMSYWWITIPVSPGVTSFVPLIVNAFFELIPMNDITSQYFSDIVVMLFGAGILSIVWNITGLDRRIASKVLTYLGSSYRSQVVFWFLLSTLMSTVIPNAVVVATLATIAYAVLDYIGEGDVKNSEMASLVLMGIAWGAGVGGVATPLGGSMNMVIISYVEELTSSEYIFIDWVIRYLPVLILLILCTTVFLVIITPKHEDGGRSREYFKDEYAKFSKMGKYEWIALLSFITAVVLSFLRPLYDEALPGMKPAYVFLTAGILVLLVSKGDDDPLVSWKSVEKNMIWELIFIFAGGLALGELINKTDAAQMIGNAMSLFNIEGAIGFVAIIVIFTIVMSDVTSNTATAAIATPLVISVAKGLGLDPLPYVFITTIGVNVSFTLPTSVRAVPVGYGMEPSFMFKKGIIITVIVYPLLVLLSYFYFL